MKSIHCPPANYYVTTNTYKQNLNEETDHGIDFAVFKIYTIVHWKCIRAIISVSGFTCAFPAMRKLNVCSEKGVLLSVQM